MSNQHCADCRYCLQHYTFDTRKIFRVHCGHCTLTRAKRKLPDVEACENFIPGPSLEESFVSEEYLSKELLRYMLDLELFPEIEGLG